MNIDLYAAFGWIFVALAAIFALGMAKPFARYYYPDLPSFPRRLAAPLIFGVLAAACFMGIGRAVLIFVVLVGLTLVFIRRWRCRNNKLVA